MYVALWRKARLSHDRGAGDPLLGTWATVGANLLRTPAPIRRRPRSWRCSGERAARPLRPSSVLRARVPREGGISNSSKSITAIDVLQRG